jgi:alkanesulfonate monooxygenase SsuD/methylene tetrahydromethanopterin reductase-like flavin-dependent oxidoreductase (luciferase family)
VGGNGPKKTLRVVAKHADEWNAIATTPEDWQRLSGILDEHCETVGRNPKEIRRSIQMMLHPAVEGQVDEQLAKLPAFEEAGVEHVIMSFYQPPDSALLEKVAPR